MKTVSENRNKALRNGVAYFLLTVCSFPLFAQSIHNPAISYTPASDCSTIKDEIYHKANPYGYLFLEYCENILPRTRQKIAHIQGKPQPSAKVLVVPQYGSEEAKQMGVSCLDGLVMLRLSDGWKQALDGEKRYYTCRKVR